MRTARYLRVLSAKLANKGFIFLAGMYVVSLVPRNAWLAASHTKHLNCEHGFRGTKLGLRWEQQDICAYYLPKQRIRDSYSLPACMLYLSASRALTQQSDSLCSNRSNTQYKNMLTTFAEIG